MRIGIVLCLVVLKALAPVFSQLKYKQNVKNEHTAEIHDTDCYRFSENARFNPYSVLDTVWFVFYHWGTMLESRTYKFYHPTKENDLFLHDALDDYVKAPVDWSARRIILLDAFNHSRLLVERNHSGYYYMYDIRRGLKKGVDFVTAEDVRMKQKNNYIGMMFCLRDYTYIMAGVNDVPRKRHLLDAASSLGYHGRGGRSYLYRGHHWMPVGEAEEHPWEEYLQYRGHM